MSRRKTGTPHPEPDQASEIPRLKAVGGSGSDAWNTVLALQAMETLWLKNSNEQERENQRDAAVMGLIEIAPSDVLEGMMAAQLLAAHNAAMECYRRAMLGDQTFEGRRENLSQANKLSRSFAVLLEALNRHRGKGQQKVTVEHVHVHSGGQAVVGVVERMGGGERAKPEDQPHAKQIAHAPQPEVRRAEEEDRQPLPVTRDD